ncbi:MAG: hypothetical protein ACTSV2_10095 [Candidatus Thorarchaeota archaeon]
MTSSRDYALIKYRTVSELRTQFQCEYRLYLQQKHGNQSNQASRRGTMLHDQSSSQILNYSSSNGLVKILIVILTAFAGILWIVG